MSERDYAKEAREEIDNGRTWQNSPTSPIHRDPPRYDRAQALALLACHGELRRIADAMERGTGEAPKRPVAVEGGSRSTAPPDWDLIERGIRELGGETCLSALAEVRRCRETP